MGEKSTSGLLSIIKIKYKNFKMNYMRMLIIMVCCHSQVYYGDNKEKSMLNATSRHQY